MNRGAADLLALIGILLILLGWLGGCGRQLPKQYEGRMKYAGSCVWIDTETGVRQDAIDIAMQYCPDDDGSCSKAGNDIREMLDELEDMPSAQQWIPCSERLPENDELVLVTDDSGGVKTVDVDRCGQYECSKKRFWYYTQNAVAWMPLPEPWKGEEGEAD